MKPAIQAIKGQSGAGMVGPWVPLSVALASAVLPRKGAPLAGNGAPARRSDSGIPVGNHGDNKIQPPSRGNHD